MILHKNTKGVASQIDDAALFIVLIVCGTPAPLR